jgi:hypothetical protein
MAIVPDRPESPWHTSPGAIDALHRLHAAAQAEDFRQLHRLHIPRSHWRYSDEPMPVEQADNIRHQRERLSRHLAWAAIAFTALIFGLHFL